MICRECEKKVARFAIETVTRQQGRKHRGFICSNGLEALNILYQYIPDLVITDIVMPDQNGIGIINTLRQKYPNIKIIAISGGGRMISKDYLKIAKMLGAHHVMQKPFDNLELLDKIKELINPDD